jgi:hypothetical protein
MNERPAERDREHMEEDTGKVGRPAMSLLQFFQSTTGKRVA